MHRLPTPRRRNSREPRLHLHENRHSEDQLSRPDAVRGAFHSFAWTSLWGPKVVYEGEPPCRGLSVDTGHRKEHRLVQAGL